MSERPYVALLRAFAAWKVDFAVAGGVAVVLHGVPRMTFDLDIVIDEGKDNIERLIAALGQEGFRPRLPVPIKSLADPEIRKLWIEERNLIAFTLIHPGRPMEELDIVLVHPFSWAEVAGSTVWRTIDDVSVPVVGRSLLRRMKLATGRDKDKVDAELLGEEEHD